MRELEREAAQTSRGFGSTSLAPPFLVPVPNLPFKPFKPFNHKPNFNIFQDSTVLTATLFSVGSTGLRILNTPCRDGHAPSGVNPQNLPRCNRPVENLGSCEVTKIKNGNNRKSLLFDSHTRFCSNMVQNLQALLHRHENLKSLENDDENKNSQSHGCSAGSAIV